MCRSLQRTVSDRLKEVGESYRHHLTADEIVAAAEHVMRISTQGRATGCGVIQRQIFRQLGYRPSREAVLNALRQHDPEGMAARQERILPRRTYDVTESMVLWHIDSEALLVLSLSCYKLPLSWRDPELLQLLDV